MGLATLGWISGCLTIWSSLFAIGNFLYSRTTTALMLTGVFIVSGSVLLYIVNHLWSGGEDVRGQQKPLGAMDSVVDKH
jgi:hypothetical protein